MITFSPWLVLLIGTYLLIVLIVTSGYRRRRRYRDIPTQQNLMKAAGVLVLLALVVNAASFGFSSIKRVKTITVPDHVVAEKLFGFKPGVEYPLTLGSQTTSFNSSTTLESGFFSVVSITHTTGGPAITAAFTQGGTTYTLSLPRSSTPIEIREDMPPTMVIRFKEGEWLESKKRHADLTTTDAQHPQNWSACRYVIADFAIACHRTEMIDRNTVVISDTSRYAGLGKLIENSFASAKLVMTQSMFDKLIGRIT